MFQNFSLFQSHLDLAHQYWAKVLREGDWAIDATCGNGNDTLLLAKVLEKSGGVIGLDIQAEAILNTKTLLHKNISQEGLSRVHLFCQSHADFPPLALKHPIRLIVYNLGYLPKGDKRLTTMTESTLASLNKALDLIAPSGVISVTCYPGHPEGAQEERAILDKISTLSPMNWNICRHTFPNRTAAPSLILIQNN
jgi:SAM-dependent methyltransferase